MCRQSSWALQARLDGETRFLRTWTEAAGEGKVGMASVHRVFAELFEVTAQEAQKLSVYCADADGNLFELTETTLPEALALASGSHHMLRLQSSRWAASGEPDDAEERRCHRLDTSLCRPDMVGLQRGKDRQMTHAEARECFRMDGGIEF